MVGEKRLQQRFDEGEVAQWELEGPELTPWLRGWMNNRTKRCEFDTFFDRDASLFQVRGGDLRHEFVMRERHAPCESTEGGLERVRGAWEKLAGCRGAGAATGIGGANGRAEDCPEVDGALGEDVIMETGTSAA